MHRRHDVAFTRILALFAGAAASAGAASAQDFTWKSGMSGDANEDGVVNFLDLNIVVGMFGQSAP